jgi:signal transduction histidine kinase
MKKKLYIVLFLTTILLAGIIVLQLYWSFTAYKLNKEKFDGDINIAMQRALDSCKKDYFDSIRVVMVKRLSAPGTIIRIDTLKKADTANTWLKIWLKNEQASMGEPMLVSKYDFDFYRAKIKRAATNAGVITEMSFYEPRVVDNVLLLLGLEDSYLHIKEERKAGGMNGRKPFREVVYDTVLHNGIFALPPGYRSADSVKLHAYFKEAIHQLHPKNRRSDDFRLVWSEKPIPAHDLDPHHIEQLRYSETDQFTYKYHGFLFLQHTDRNALFVRVVYDKAQAGVLSEMVLILGLSGLLIVFTKFCLFYIIRIMVKQKKLTELKDDFINNMTHELKTPIATITVAIEGLQKFNGLNDPEKTQRYLQTSRNELGRLDGLVTKVLNVAAFENKEVVLVKEKVLIDALMNDLIETEKLKATKEVSISYTNCDCIKEIEADKLHLRNVMQNLIDNAVKYATAPVDIKISLTKHNKYAVFSIKDNGMGIPAKHIKHIFDKFHRVPAGNVHNVKGTGLGLHYVRYIVQAHGGKVAVTSQVSKGSEFTVSIPLKNG